MTVVPLRRVEGTASELSDGALIAACGVGESAALGALFDRFYDPVRGFLARMSGADDGELDDLVQVTFESVFHAARRYDRRSTVKTWILGVANNVARHHFRGRLRRRRLTAAVAEVPDASGNAVREVLDREVAARLHAAILALSPKLRETFVLVYLVGVSGSDVARIVGAREGAVWKRLHEARAQLRTALEGIWP